MAYCPVLLIQNIFSFVEILWLFIQNQLALTKFGRYKNYTID